MLDNLNTVATSPSNCLQHKLPLVNECTQPRILKVGKLQFVAEQRICLNKLLKFNQHNRSCRFCISVLGQLLILPINTVREPKNQ